MVETSGGWEPNMVYFSSTNGFVSQTEALGSCSVLGEHLLDNVKAKAYPGFQMSATIGSTVNLLTSIAIHPDNHERILAIEMVKAENSNQILAVVVWLDSAIIPAHFERIPVKSRFVAVRKTFACERVIRPLATNSEDVEWMAPGCYYSRGSQTTSFTGTPYKKTQRLVRYKKLSSTPTLKVLLQSSQTWLSVNLHILAFIVVVLQQVIVRPCGLMRCIKVEIADRALDLSYRML